MSVWQIRPEINVNKKLYDVDDDFSSPSISYVVDSTKKIKVTHEGSNGINMFGLDIDKDGKTTYPALDLSNENVKNVTSMPNLAVPQNWTTAPNMVITNSNVATVSSMPMLKVNQDNMSNLTDLTSITGLSNLETAAKLQNAPMLELSEETRDKITSLDNLASAPNLELSASTINKITGLPVFTATNANMSGVTEMAGLKEIPEAVNVGTSADAQLNVGHYGQYSILKGDRMEVKANQLDMSSETSGLTLRSNGELVVTVGHDAVHTNSYTGSRIRVGKEKSSFVTPGINVFNGQTWAHSDDLTLFENWVIGSRNGIEGPHECKLTQGVALGDRVIMQNGVPVQHTNPDKSWEELSVTAGKKIVAKKIYLEANGNNALGSFDEPTTLGGIECMCHGEGNFTIETTGRGRALLKSTAGWGTWSDIRVKEIVDEKFDDDTRFENINVMSMKSQFDHNGDIIPNISAQDINTLYPGVVFYEETDDKYYVDYNALGLITLNQTQRLTNIINLLATKYNWDISPPTLNSFINQKKLNKKDTQIINNTNVPDSSSGASDTKKPK